MKWALIAVLFALLFAPVANADTYDIDHDLQFVREINQAGIKYDTRENLIDMGHAMCDALVGGGEYTDLIDVIVRDTDSRPYLANVLASKAVENMCPSQWYKVVISQPSFRVQDRVPI